MDAIDEAETSRGAQAECASSDILISDAPPLSSFQSFPRPSAAAELLHPTFAPLPPVVPVTGVWTNHTRVTFARLCAGQQSNIANREVKVGLPLGWKGRAPFKGARIVAYKSKTTFISPGDEGSHRPSETLEESGIPRQPKGKSIWSWTVLSDGEPPADKFTFVPLLDCAIGSQQKTQGSQLLTESALETGASQLNASLKRKRPSWEPATMVGKKSGRALQLEEGAQLGQPHPALFAGLITDANNHFPDRS
jgi:hypothetical protein